jgi:hypothetical protein
MTLPRYRLRPTLRAALVSFLVHHNPFYLLSALSMVAGCYAINSGLSPRTGELPKLLTLLGILNGYEAIVIALGLFLIRRRGILRDGRTLLLIEAPFLVDLTFINAEAGSVSFESGAILNLIVLTLAIIKVAVVLRLLNGHWPRRVIAFIAAELAVLFMMPTALKRFDRAGAVTEVHFYACWWAVGLLLMAYEMQGRLWPETRRADSIEPPVAVTIRRLYTTLPLLSLIVHLGMLHWVYRVDFVLADAAPVLLGVTVALGRLAPRRVGLRIALPIVALLLTGNEPAGFQGTLAGGVRITPLLLTGGMAYLTYVYCFFLPRALLLITAGAVVALTVAFGPTVDQILNVVSLCWRQAAGWANNLLPKTAMQWGLVAVGGSFGFLALGAAVSLRKTPALPEGSEPSSA